MCHLRNCCCCTAGKLLPGCVLPSVSSFEWSADGSCLYYCVPDELGRPSKVRVTWQTLW
jgi:hypothetical protein